MPVDDTGALAAIEAMAARVSAACDIIVAKSALAVQTTGMGLTQVQSGTLRRSWHIETLGHTARVGPTTVYARRQELGFQGADSLGRVYVNDPGWPYVKPAFDATLPLIQTYAVTTVAEAIGG